MIKAKITEDLVSILNELGYESVTPSITPSQNSSFGDYSTNIALQLSKLNSKNGQHSPQEIATKIAQKMEKMDYLEKVEIKGAGFINFFLKDSVLLEYLKEEINIPQAQNQKVMVEYGHVNLLKEVHIGHLRTFILGESLSRVLQAQGYEVFRANYQGDIGLHIAKAIWGIQQLGLPEADPPAKEKAEFLGRAYAHGNKLYEEDPRAKEEIDQINTKIYQKTPGLMSIYDLSRRWSIEYLEPIYQKLGIKYDRCFFESEVADLGKKIVHDNIGKIFEESEGAVIFRGEKYDLFTLVFINSAGNPTYEAKEMGLAQFEYETFKYDKEVHVVANEQAGYFKVIIKAAELLFPELVGKKYHLSYGFVDLKEGKMSSRTGNVVSFDSLYETVYKKVSQVIEGKVTLEEEELEKIAIGAIKFAYLKYSPGPNMIFDLEQSISLQGDSGPYVQYTYTRTQSILRNIEQSISTLENSSLNKEERAIVARILQFDEIISQPPEDFKPHLICEYLLNLSGEYNLFYQKHRVLESDEKELRILLTKRVGEVLKQGMNLLGIELPKRM